MVDLFAMKFYKVWGGVFEFAEYSRERDEKSDWSGYYFQHNIRHSLTYVNKKYDDGYELVSLVEMRLKNQGIKVVRLEDKIYGDGKISGREKAELAKKELAIKTGIVFDEQKLMEALGQHSIILELLDAD